MQSFGSRIATARKQLDQSLRDVAPRAEISPSQLSKLERDVSHPSKETVEKLAYALNIDRYELLTLAGYAAVETYVTSDELKAINIQFFGGVVNEESTKYNVCTLRGVVAEELRNRYGDSEDTLVDEVTRELQAALELILKRKIRR